MPRPPRPISFILAACEHGSMIVSRHDYQIADNAQGYGVGFQLLESSQYEAADVSLLLTVLDCRRRYFGDGVVAIDGGANLGVHTLEWARHMHGWGQVLAFEAQEMVFYALAGNIALNNCMNARARLTALGDACGEILVPQPDYFTPASFGSLELRPTGSAEPAVVATGSSPVPMVTLDSLAFERLDLVKLDVEGMELEVLNGALECIERHHPVLFIEILKIGAAALEAFAANQGYRLFQIGINALAIHSSDPTLRHFSLQSGGLTFSA